MNRALILSAALALAVLVLASSSLFIVNQAEQALVLRFGAHRATIKEPGLHVKLPFIEDVVRYDLRLLGLDPPDEQIILGDQKRIVVDTFTRYRIADPLKFYQSVRTETLARAVNSRHEDRPQAKIFMQPEPRGHSSLSVGDRVAAAALRPAIEAKYLEQGAVVTHLGDEGHICADEQG